MPKERLRYFSSIEVSEDTREVFEQLEELLQGEHESDGRHRLASKGTHGLMSADDKDKLEYLWQLLGGSLNVKTVQAHEASVLPTGLAESTSGSGSTGGSTSLALSSFINGVATVDTAGTEITFGFTLPDTDYVVQYRAYDTNSNEVIGLRIVKTTTKLTIYAPEENTTVEYAAFLEADGIGILTEVETTGAGVAFDPARADTNYIVLYRAYDSNDVQLVGVRVVKTVSSVTFYPPESNATIEFLIKAF